ncbi:hypothetical protein AURDEDRAFT_165292 [Auricularia subglabra TFB-10046 SS5]|nr:hypothetical protein AURDEDRAFT_165292 [Auricularia subglabra TFB-10046 SS5]
MLSRKDPDREAKVAGLGNCCKPRTLITSRTASPIAIRLKGMSLDTEMLALSATSMNTGAMEDMDSPDLSESHSGDESAFEDLYVILSTCWTANEHATGHGSLTTVRDAYLEQGPTINPRSLLEHSSTAANDHTGNEAPARAPGAPINAVVTAGTGSAHIGAVVPARSEAMINHAACVLPTPGMGATRRVTPDPPSPLAQSHNGGNALSSLPLSTASSGTTHHLTPSPLPALGQPQHDGTAESFAPPGRTGRRQAVHGRPSAVAPSQDGGATSRSSSCSTASTVATHQIAPDPPCALAPQDVVPALQFASFSTTDTGMTRLVWPGLTFALPPGQDDGPSSFVSPSSTAVRHRVAPGHRLALARSQDGGNPDLLRVRKDAGDLKGRIVELDKTNAQCLELLANRPTKRLRMFK